MGSLIKILFNTAILALIILYTYLFYLTLNPKVSEDYYNYYISKTMDLSPKEIMILQPITPKTIYDHSSIRHIGFLKGWSYAETTHRWSDSTYSEIIFKILDISQFDGQIHLSIFPHDKQEISLFLNDNKIYSTLVTKNTVLKINFEKKLLKNGFNKLSFHIPNAKKPGTTDQRLLGIGFCMISIH